MNFCQYPCCLTLLLIFIVKVNCESSTSPARDLQLIIGGSGPAVGETCLHESIGGNTPTCVSPDLSIITATDIFIWGDGCQFPGDIITFTATFLVDASLPPDYEVVLRFSVDGDENGDGAISGDCANHNFYSGNGDGDANPELTMTAVCNFDDEGFLKMSYCASWIVPTMGVRRRLDDSIPTNFECNCDPNFSVDIVEGQTNSGGAGIVGDPHLETWFRRKFDYQGICDLVMLHNEGFGNGEGLDVHIRTEEDNGTSFISAAVIKIGQDKLEVHNDGVYYWNETPNAELPPTMGSATLTHFLQDEWLPIWQITTPKGGILFVQIFDDMVDIKMSGFSSEDMGDSVGLMGDFNTGFLLDREGNWVFDTDKFGQEWQVRDTDKMLFHVVREPQFPAVCRMPDAEATKQLLESYGVTDAEALEMCKNTGLYLDQCKRDYQLTRNEDMGNYYEFLDGIAKNDRLKHGAEPSTVDA